MGVVMITTTITIIIIEITMEGGGTMVTFIVGIIITIMKIITMKMERFGITTPRLLLIFMILCFFHL
jgi:hypothetical protein